VSEKKVFVRQLQLTDLEAVLALEHKCYAHPWTQGMFASGFDSPGAIAVGAYVGAELAGYLFCRLIVGELEILNIATAPHWQRRGVASCLFEHVFTGAYAVQTAYLEVRRSNEAAQAFYHRCGFETCGLRRAYYRDGEDAILMRRKFGA